MCVCACVYVYTYVCVESISVIFGHVGSHVPRVNRKESKCNTRSVITHTHS